MSLPFNILLLAGVALAPLAARAADGDPTTAGNHIAGARFDIHANFGGYASFGAGMRIDIPIIREGLIASADDELALSPGFDVFFANAYHDYYDGTTYFIPSIVFQWNFYLSPDWSIFPEAGVAAYVGDADHMPHGSALYLAPDFGFGARYHFSARNALLMRVSTPTGFQLGLTF